MTRVLLRATALAFALAGGTVFGPALAQQGARPTAKPGPERPAPDRGGGPAVIACPSLANYRMLVRPGAPPAAAVLADPKADHLGCAALPRGRITGIADRVALGGQAYDCLGVQGTTACHWTEAGGSFSSNAPRGAGR